jgi:hypothetical protein
MPKQSPASAAGVLAAAGALEQPESGIHLSREKAGL